MQPILTFLIGLDRWIQIYCVVLMLLALGLAVYAWTQSRKVKNATRELSALLARHKNSTAEQRASGRRLDEVESLRLQAEKLGPIAADWWGRLDSALVSYGPDSRNRGWFLSANPGEVLDEELVIHRHYDSNFFAGVPGLLTSLGLLGTFVAILKGLSGLYLDGEVIKGVPVLVGSLSGKFTTSVIALFMSAVYTLFEGLGMQAGMRNAREQLLGRVRDVLPRLTTSHVLVDLQTESLKQSRSLSNISSDLVDKVAGLFAEQFRVQVVPTLASGVSDSMSTRLTTELVPVLNQVGAGMIQVSEAIQRLEATKQDSVVGELRGLTTSLQQSLTDSLSNIGARFSEALRGSTRDEFSGLARTIQESGQVLGSMNESFTAMQSALRALIEESRQTTSSQLSKSAERAEQLNQLVEGLLVRLNETASNNATHVSAVLTQVVTELSDRVTALSNDLTTKVAEATNKSQAVAAESVRQAGEWSARSDQKLTELLAALEGKVADFDKASAALMGAHRFVEATLAQSGDGLRAMKEAANEVRTYSATLGGLQQKIALAHQAQADVSVATQRAISELGGMSERHEILLARYDGTFERAKAVFDGLDGRLRNVLEIILEKVQQYNTGVERNFQAIVQHVNATMPQMGEVLAGAALELREQVDELTEVLAAHNGKARG